MSEIHSTDTRIVEYTCRHRDLITQPLHSDWHGVRWPCEVCGDYRKIIWTDGD